MFSLHVCLSAMYMWCPQRKRALDPLGLESQTIVCNLGMLGIMSRYSRRASGALHGWAISSAPHIQIFFYVGSGDLNSFPYFCSTEALIYWTISSAPVKQSFDIVFWHVWAKTTEWCFIFIWLVCFRKSKSYYWEFLTCIINKII